MSLYTEHDRQQKVKVVRLERSWELWKEQNEAFPTVPPAGQTDKLKALKPHVKAVNVPKWAQRSQESMYYIWEYMGIWGLGRCAGADGRVRFPSGQARRGQPFAMASIWNVDAPTDTGSTTLSVAEHEPFLREFSNAVSSTMAFFPLDGGPTIQVSFLPAPSAARVGFALLTPLPWHLVRRNLD
jgi:hypothetical protein